MEEQTAGATAQAGQTSAAGTSRRLDWTPLLVLLLLAAGLRTWLLFHTEVAARDSILFIRIAWQLEREPWTHVLQHAEQHPGYPVAILITSRVVRHFLTAPDTVIMQLSAQLTSVLAGTLLVIPTYYLGRELFNRTAGFWAAVLFQCLPASCRVLSDGLSEATFLLLAVTALYFAVRALRRNSPVLFGLCGLFGGLAYLTRPEGAVIVAATGLVLLGMQLTRGGRRPWRRGLACGASLAGAALLVGGPLVVVTGKLTVKPSELRSVDPNGVRGDATRPDDKPSAHTVLSGHRVMASLPLAIWRPAKGAESNRLWWGLHALTLETIKGFHYVAWVPALLGLWLFRKRFRTVPGAWVLLLLCLTVALFLWRIATFMGYVSDRHTLLILLCGSYWAVASLSAIAGWVARVLSARLPGVAERLGLKATARLVTVLLLLALLVPCLPKDFERLHVDRSGFRAVGLWLAEHTRASDEILDPYSWPLYFAGRAFQEPLRPRDAKYSYVVLERSRNGHPHLRHHQLAEHLAEGGREVFRWSGKHHGSASDIVIYALPGPAGQ
jgi:hypothetical protein